VRIERVMLSKWGATCSVANDDNRLVAVLCG